MTMATTTMLEPAAMTVPTVTMSIAATSVPVTASFLSGNVFNRQLSNITLYF